MQTFKETIEFDYPCDRCGYNWRGLTGYVIRCPECGRERTRAAIDAAIQGTASHELRERVIHIDRRATLCATGLSAALVFSLARLFMPQWFPLPLTVPMLIFLSLAALGAASFRQHAKNLPRKWDVLRAHLVISIPGTAILTTVFCAGYAAIFSLDSNIGELGGSLSLSVVPLVWMIAPLVPPGPRARRHIESALAVDGPSRNGGRR